MDLDFRENNIQLEVSEEHHDLGLVIVEDLVAEIEVQNVNEVMAPSRNMIFDSELAARSFYATYAKSQGFGVAIANSLKREGIKWWVHFQCHKGGLPKNFVDPSASNPTTKSNCKASMKIAKQIDEKWKVTAVNLEHNHPMIQEYTKYLKCYRKIPPHVQRNIELNREVGIKVNQTINSFERSMEGLQDITWMEKDVRNHTDKVRRHELKGGDAQAMLQYSKKMQADNKNFFYLIDLDEENCLTKVFWADARSREAYKEFGDAVTFDTTYLVNMYAMPFAPFVGVNHHGQSTLFGCGLVTREDTESFVWLFEAWLACMSNVQPKAIITNQSRAMQNAIGIVFPQTRHRWCLWHIMKKVPEKFKSHTMYEEIQRDINNVVYDSLTTQTFEESWGELVKKYKLENNEWLCSMFDERNRWAPAFVKDTFWAGMSTTQRSESMNAFFDGYIHSKMTLKEFVEQYENALHNKVRKEEEADAKSLNSQYQSISPFGFERQFQVAYTTKKYKLFRKQFVDALACRLHDGPIVNGVQQYFIDHCCHIGNSRPATKVVQFTIYFNQTTNETNCICRLFESSGMICSHILRVWSTHMLREVPKKYILQRWRKNMARSHTKVRLSYTNWQKKPEWRRLDELQGLFNEVADRVIFSEEKSGWLKRILLQAIESSKQEISSNMSSVTPTSSNLQFVESLGCQSDIIGNPSHGTKRGRAEKLRKISQVEKAAKAKRKRLQSSVSNSQISDMGLATISSMTFPSTQDCQVSTTFLDLNAPAND